MYAVIPKIGLCGLFRIDYKVFMPKPPKEKPECDPVKPEELASEASWEEDQKKREYYYDDSHGYEKYEPDKDDDDDEGIT
jgi:hypothetical protein